MAQAAANRMEARLGEIRQADRSAIAETILLEKLYATEQETASWMETETGAHISGLIARMRAQKETAKRGRVATLPEVKCYGT